ncbi:MAG: hypothetical protein M8349_05605 [ANME-2 cluster archaeon]|nr:hypothetical protein [ANME-2 cluster archaeon]
MMLASNDRVALDAVGVAILRMYGTTREVSEGGVFEQDQLARAVELEQGASGPHTIDIVPVNDVSEEVCRQLKGLLLGV